MSVHVAALLVPCLPVRFVDFLRKVYTNFFFCFFFPSQLTVLNGFFCRPFKNVSQLLTRNAHFVLEFVGMVSADLSLGLWVLLHWHSRVVDAAFDEIGFDAAPDYAVVRLRTSLSHLYRPDRA